MIYLNTHTYKDIGENFKKICEGKDQEVFILNDDKLCEFNLDSKVVKRSCNVKDVNDIFFCKEKDIVLCSSKGNVVAITNNSDQINFKTPDAFDLNLLSVTTNVIGNIICAGAEMKNSLFEKDENDALIVFWDIRNPNLPVGYYKESHSEDIVSLSFKNDNNYLLMSGSVDGLITIYDIRNNSEDDSIITVLNTEDTVNKCGWLSRNNMIYCFTGSEKQIMWQKVNEDFDLSNYSKNINSNYTFLQSCDESYLNEVLSLSMSESSKDLYVDGLKTHLHMNIQNDYLNGAKFLNDCRHIVAYSDKNIYLYY